MNVNEIDHVTNSYIIDVREKEEFKQSHLKDAINVPLAIFCENPGKYLKQDIENYIVCLSGGRSGQAIMYANAQGFNNVTNLLGGMMSYNGECE